jgi:peptidoglycan/LPS O-acetylase OafA/YrhL
MNRVKQEGYMPQLDSLRAFAVTLVIISHWFDKNHFLNRFTPNGTLGVTLFFVLSGFLITGILLKNKIQTEQGYSIKKVFATFYFRRALRIFPVYYLLLFVLWILHNNDFLSSAWWHVFYVSNVFFYINHGFAGSVSHFWSLSVEEQFYLIWPVLIFSTPRRSLVTLFGLGILAAIVFRIIITSPQSEMGRFLMPGSFDSFCIGGLLAYGKLYQKNWYIFLLNNTGKLILFLLGLYVLFVFVEKQDIGYWWYNGFYYTLISLVFGVTIAACSQEVKNKLIAPILNFRGFIFLGKISYGIYLFHNFLPYIYGIHLPGVFKIFDMYAAELLRFLILIAIATLSWYLYERPILKLKNKFNYKLVPAL